MRVRNSLAEYTPFRFSPSMFMNFGRPAPLPIKQASHSCMSSSMVKSLPTTALVMISTPIFLSASISLYTIFFGKRNSGMP